MPRRTFIHVFLALLTAASVAAAGQALRVQPEGYPPFVLLGTPGEENTAWYDAEGWLRRFPGSVQADPGGRRLIYQEGARQAVLSADPPFALRNGQPLPDAPPSRVVDGRLAVSEQFLLERSSEFLGRRMAVEKVHRTGLLRIVLDPGHGGPDVGSRGSGNLDEKGAMLSLARDIAGKLRRKGYEVRLTRESDRALTPAERAAFANHWEADLFLSLHASGGGRAQARGFELFVAPAPAAGTDPRLWSAGQVGRAEESRRWAETLRANLGQAVPTSTAASSPRRLRSWKRSRAPPASWRSRTSPSPRTPRFSPRRRPGANSPTPSPAPPTSSFAGTPRYQPIRVERVGRSSSLLLSYLGRRSSEIMKDPGLGDMMRFDGRQASALRSARIERGVLKFAEGSAMIEMGDTRVLCAATVEDGVPPFLRGSGTGWVTAEYGMLPRATQTRTQREAARGKQGGRTLEIQRLIGRSLRAAVDLSAFGERTVVLDCDVLQADGGTRTASITGGYVALVEAFRSLVRRNVLSTLPIRDEVAAVSVGLVGGRALLDLNYREDSGADVDMNVVMTGRGELIEAQATGEARPFRRESLLEFLDLAAAGIQELIALQREVLGAG